MGATCSGSRWSRRHGQNERVLVIGRRNHFGSKSARGTQTAAIIYSLVESAKVCGIDPIAYLTEVSTRARENPGAILLPADFTALRAAA
jgi:hypothetical protein